MHESTLVYKIFETISPSLEPHHKLQSILLDVGELSCVNTSTLTQLYDITKKGTFAEHSELKLRIVEGGFDITINSIEVTTWKTAIA